YVVFSERIALEFTTLKMSTDASTRPRAVWNSFPNRTSICVTRSPYIVAGAISCVAAVPNAQRPVQVLHLRARHRVAREDLRTGAVLRRAGRQPQPWQRITRQTLDVGLKRRFDAAVERARRRGGAGGRCTGERQQRSGRRR